MAAEAMTWDGVMVAEGWTSQDALIEFRQAFADQPDLIRVVEQDPSVLPTSVRIWVEPGTDPAVIAHKADEAFPDNLELDFRGEQRPQASDFPDSTLPPPDVLLTQVEPIYGYGDYRGIALPPQKSNACKTKASLSSQTEPPGSRTDAYPSQTTRTPKSPSHAAEPASTSPATTAPRADTDRALM